MINIMHHNGSLMVDSRELVMVRLNKNDGRPIMVDSGQKCDNHVYRLVLLNHGIMTFSNGILIVTDDAIMVNSSQYKML